MLQLIKDFLIVQGAGMNLEMPGQSLPYTISEFDDGSTDKELTSSKEKSLQAL